MQVAGRPVSALTLGPNRAVSSLWREGGKAFLLIRLTREATPGGRAASAGSEATLASRYVARVARVMPRPAATSSMLESRGSGWLEWKSSSEATREGSSFTAGGGRAGVFEMGLGGGSEGAGRVF